MIGILLDDNAFEQDIRELLVAFYPGETFVHKEKSGVPFCIERKKSPEQTGCETRDTSCGTSTFHAFDVDKGEMSEALRQEWEDYLGSRPVAITEGNHLETKDRIKRRLYLMLQSETRKQLPWGTLTGIRPPKAAITLLEEGKDREEIAQYMQDTYLTSNEKIELIIKTAENGRELLSTFDYRNGYSLYVGILFCPTTCLCCSLTSYPIGRWKGRTQGYLNALYKEMDCAAEAMAERAMAVEQRCDACTGASQRLGTGEGPLHLDIVYFGGGIPIFLSAEDSDQLLIHLETMFSLSGIQELIAEAGRPDSITREKLGVLKKHHITRISTNPQTMRQEALGLIGRHHTVDMVRDCFRVARELGFDNINMDLIVGLPEEDAEDVRRTTGVVKTLDPDSIIVHSLVIKWAFRLNIDWEHYASSSIRNTQEMIDLTAAYAREMGMEPYHLHRQKNMAGSFENVGHAKPGKACLYNILAMGEKQTIVACDAGTATKIVSPEENHRERTENVKDVEQYITRIDEMIERKRAQKL